MIKLKVCFFFNKVWKFIVYDIVIYLGIYLVV